jgi:Holliday junction resolvase RusA-like endonuclease|tara:strand:+ start:3129 stop:3530 length:402 start_codon:yes stop_codon:yes gene_type:complete
MEAIINLTCPLYVDLPRKTTKDKRVYINMNSYRNLHFLVNNQVKKMYLEAVRSQLEGLTIQTPVEITYKVYKKTARRLDKMNVVAITSKYLLDAVTELGCWEDDNDDHVKTEIILPTELDRANSRVEVIIRSI